MPLRRLVAEAFEGFLAFDGRVLSSLRMLVVRPGFLTLEYLAGRRVRWVSPVKLYLFLSLALFLGLQLTDRSLLTHSSVEGSATGEATAQTTNERVAALEEAEELGFWRRRFIRFLVEPEVAQQVFRDRLAQTVIVFVPFFAVLLQLFYRRQRRYYIEHLVFSLHLHAFGYLVVLVLIPIYQLPGLANAEISQIAVWPILVYTFLALRRVYGEGRGKTLLKLLAVAVLHSLGALVGMIGAVIATLLTM